MIQDILIVCEGNICRSPMAQGLMSSNAKTLRITSAGLNAAIGQMPPKLAVDLMAARGVDIAGHVGSALTLEQVKGADLILAMTKFQQRRIEEKFPFAKGKAYRFCEHDGVDVVDPYRQDRRVFEMSLQQIESGTNRWLEVIGRLTHKSNDI